jgi:hypothetical protein
MFKLCHHEVFSICIASEYLSIRVASRRAFLSLHRVEGADADAMLMLPALTP